MNRKGVSVIIATWNGRELLQKNLPFLFQALTHCVNPYEVIIVDDAGEDDTESFLQKNYPEIRYLKLHENIGNGQALNRGAEMARYELLFFLDNDVEVTPHFLDPLLHHFENPGLFAVGCTPIEHGKETSSPIFFPKVHFRWGIFWYYYESLPVNIPAAVSALFASAGHALVSREKFEALGGFDDLYGKFYLEDLDLCYRAWKKGWKNLIEPKSRVYHEMAGTISKILSRSAIERKQWKNRFLFTWKNIHRPSLLSQHLFFLIPEIVLLPLVGKMAFTMGFFDALTDLGLVFQKRSHAKNEAIVSDLDVFKQIGSFVSSH